MYSFTPICSTLPVRLFFKWDLELTAFYLFNDECVLLFLQIEYSWNISLSHHKFGEMFITCGVLYGIDSSTERETKIRLVVFDHIRKCLTQYEKMTRGNQLSIRPKEAAG